MAAGPFLTHEANLLALLNAFENDADVAAVLVSDSHTPDRASDLTYDDISGNEIDDSDYAPQEVANKATSVVSTRVRLTHDKITFTEEGNIEAKYLYFVIGDPESLQSTDLIGGHIDLNTSGGTLVAADGEFSYAHGASGLAEILRSAAPA